MHGPFAQFMRDLYIGAGIVCVLFVAAAIYLVYRVIYKNKIG